LWFSHLCRVFKADALWFATGVLVYNTSILQKLYLMPLHWHKKTIYTIRWALIETAGKLVKNGRSLILKLAANGGKFLFYERIRSHFLQLC